ncbi:DUF2637 domain-containing protein [Actinomadura rubrisoli]|uniref:DUF2637 domain-containing protein n=1 Tax=Actinomadura rubrisoli TaxID=2530368 RepID=A0A4R5B664_9ACTN|nr:DUF2637 domain-containing protein [Actinomadura rubrisoli]TDD80110.1 DUF2637 domain-containing protein [Actinomadura rubrisoli]
MSVSVTAPHASPPLTWPQRVVAGLAGLLCTGLAGLGGWGSFDSVRDLAEPWFGAQAWIVPVGVDLGILALLTAALLMEWLSMPMPMLRWSALGFTGATVWLNVSAAHGDATGIVMHAAMPALFITFVEGLRHAVRRRVGLASGRVREGIPAARWAVAPVSSFRLWRRMIRWQVTSYAEALRTEQQRLHAVTLLAARYGAGWRNAAPADLVWMLSDGVYLEEAFARVAALVARSETEGGPESSDGDVPGAAAPPPARGTGGKAAGRVAATPADRATARRGSTPGRRAAATSAAGPRHGEVSAVGRGAAGGDTEARARQIRARHPGISGAELGRRLNLSARQGQRLLQRLAEEERTSRQAQVAATATSAA